MKATHCRSIAVGVGIGLLIAQYAVVLTGQTACAHARRLRQRTLPTTASQPPPVPTLPPLPPPGTGCHTFPHTEMGGGGVVGGGAHLLLANASECCAACQKHNTAKPRPRGRLNCTTWVWNADPSHPQSRECWFKTHANPWADIALLAGGARSWTTGIVVAPTGRTAFGHVPTARSCGDDRWRRPRNASTLAQPLYFRPATPGVHFDELSLCPPVSVPEASVAIDIGDVSHGRDSSIRIRLNRAASPNATAWFESVVDAGSCATNRSEPRCKPHCCNFYRPEAVVGVHRLPERYLRDHGLDPASPPHWGRNYWWGAPYGFLQGRLWHAGAGPWRNDATSLPSEHHLPTLHRGTVELVGGGPDFLIALADHPMMPPHNAFGHVVEEDMHFLDELVERGPLKVQNWGTINATVFERPVHFSLRRLR